jgi:isopenicillin-N N-acyltransferase-like protein
MGRQIGEQTSEKVKHSLENAHHLLESTYESLQLTWDGAEIQARKYLPFAQERYPEIVEELQGIAEGAGVLFDDLVVLNAMEAVTTDALH